MTQDDSNNPEHDAEGTPPEGDDPAQSDSSDETPPLEEDIAPSGNDSTDPEDLGLLGQDELDALLAAAEGREIVQQDAPPQQEEAPEPEEGEPESPPKAEARQSDIDLIVAEAAREPEEGEPESPPKAEARQSDIDLIVAEAAGNEPVSSDEPEAPAEEVDVGGSAEETSDEPEPKAEPVEATSDTGGAVSDAEIEAALRSVEGETSVESAEVKPEVGPEPIESLDADMDALLSSPDDEAVSDDPQLTAENDESAILGPDADESLVEGGMDDRLDVPQKSPEEETTPEDASSDLSAHAEEDASEAALSEVEAEAEPEPEDPATVLERVASENIAAGAPENAAGMATTPSPEKSVDPQSVSTDSPAPDSPIVVADDAPATIDLEEEFTVMGRDAPLALLTALKRSPLRTISSVAAGIVFALGAFVLLYTNQFRPASDIASFPISDATSLDRVAMYVRELLDAGDPSKAVKLLDDVLARTPENLEGVDNARYLRLEAMYQELPAAITTPAADRMHKEIDYLLETARSHPRAPEALYWKAKVYERESNPIAARAELRGILENFGNATNLDRVILALSESLLEADRPMEAVSYLQRLLQDFSASAFAPHARLLMGDAYAAADLIEDARVVYIRVAENQSNQSIGTVAFQRIGSLALESGDYESAIRELEARLETATTVKGNDRIYLLLAKAYRAVGRLQDARDILTELIDFFPESVITPSAFVELSKVMSGLGLGREAVRMATQTVQRYPDNTEVLKNAGALLSQTGDTLGAAHAFLAAHSAGAAEPELLLSAGRLFQKTDAFTDATKTFDTLITLYPRSPQALDGNIEWARILFDQGHISDAIGRLESMALATEGHARQLLVLKAMAEMYSDLGFKTQVINVYSQIAGLTEEPEMLALAATALIREGAPDVGIRVAERVDPAALKDKVAYDFLMAQADVLLRRDADKALAIMEQAHAAYADERTPEGIQKLLEANLTRRQSARARTLVAELKQRVSLPENVDQRESLDRAAVTWGDYLFKQKDYRAAVDAYAIVLEPLSERNPADAGKQTPLTEVQVWSMYQEANALFRLARYQESIDLYTEVASSRSPWADDAGVQAASARLELRLRGEPMAETRNTG